MGKKVDTTTIEDDDGSIELTVRQHDVLAQTDLMVTIGHSALPMLVTAAPHLLVAAQGGELDIPGLLSKLDMRTFVAAAAEMLQRLGGGKASALAIELLKSSSAVVNGKNHDLSKREKILAAFNGRWPSMMRAALFAIEVNFGGFIGGKRNAETAATQDAEPDEATDE